MKLFSRGQQEDNHPEDDLEGVELPQRTDFNESCFEEDPFASPTMPQTSSARVIPYGIKNTIELMRRLPSDNNEVVVTVVKQTLESMNIEVVDIIKDAESKEARIRQQHKTLEEEVKSLEIKISQRNQQIAELSEDLKETIDVRERLQLAVNIDKKNEPKAPQQTKKNKKSGTHQASVFDKAKQAEPLT